jgi:adenylate cyclase
MVCRLHTFLFADLAGFTDFTDRHGDERAAEFAVSFHERVAALATEHGCEIVKTIGDAVMVRSEDCRAAVRLAQQLVRRGAAKDLPLVRAGLDTGPAVQRNGDWFGATVNIASRVTDLAGAGELLMTERTRDACDAEPAERGCHRLKGVAGPQPLFAAQHMLPLST